MKICKIEGCENKTKNRVIGVCNSHYLEKLYLKKPLCSIDNCGNRVRARGWCVNHWRRWKLYGDPHRVQVVRHGFYGSPEYYVWQGMIQRCTNPKNPRYVHYGGRGIRVYDRWRSSFLLFLYDVGERPSRNLSIDRIDNDGNYEPGNVRWATWHQQRLNQRKRKSYLTAAKKGVSGHN